MGRRVKSFNRTAAPTTFFLAPFSLGVLNFGAMMLNIFMHIAMGQAPIKQFLLGVAIHLLLMFASSTQPFIFRMLGTALENLLISLAQRARNLRYVRV